VRRADRYGPAECEDTIAELRAWAEVPENAPADDLLAAARLTCALGDLVRERGWDAVSVKCQYELSQEYGMTACLPLSILSERGTICCCEGDVLCTVSMAMLAYLSGSITTYGDVLDVRGDRVLLSACGFAPFSLAEPGKPVRIAKFDEPGIDGLFNSFALRSGRVTIARLVEGQGDYRLIVATGQGLESELRQGFYPALEVQLDGGTAAFVDTMPSQHYAFCYGDHAAALDQLGRLLGIEVIRA
jgi:L-fucose isomerase-like protein